MEPASGKLLETLGWERDCAAGAVGDLFQGKPSHVSLRTHHCWAPRAGRKKFSHLTQLPKVWEAVMFCKRRVPQFYSAWYLLVVSCAADGSPSSPGRAPRSPSHCAVGGAPQTVLGLPHCKSSLLASMVASNSWAPPRNFPKRYTFIFYHMHFLPLTKPF